MTYIDWQFIRTGILTSAVYADRPNYGWADDVENASMKSLSIRILTVAILLLLPLSINAEEKKSALCSEFQHRLNEPAGLIPFAVEEKKIQQEDFNFTIPNVDVDGDKIKDKILLFRAGSASIVPSDYSSVTLILSSTGKKFTAEMQRFFIIHFKSKYYIVASNLKSEEGPEIVDIKSMEHDGIKQLCSFTCGIKGGSCVPH